MAVNLKIPAPSDIFPVHGVEIGVTEAGIRKANRRDLTVFRLSEGSTVAGVFTRNRFCAAPVQICQEHLAAGGPIRALVINTGNANAGTGEAGLDDARLVCAAVAERLGTRADAVLPYSTGVIMEPLPADRIVAALPAARGALGERNWHAAARAIMTTDTVPKGASRRVTIDGAAVSVTGIAKGAGMIHPNMATMLSFMATDAPVAADVLAPLLREVADVSFNGATVDGRETTLGRGGSDFSGSILAAVLDAAEFWIWTDVDGIMSADPRLVPDARVLDEVTYNEAAELAYNGAKVLHPRRLAPLVERQIPVWSKNSFNLAHKGTRIVPDTPHLPGPRAVTSISNVALISVEPASSAITGARIMARVLDSLASADAEVLAFSSSSYRESFCFLVRGEELDAVLRNLEASLALELAHGYVKPVSVDNNVGLVAVVGEGMRGTPGLAGRIFMAISRQNVNIIAIAQGSSELTISIVVRRDGLERAIRAVHSECQMGVAQVEAGLA